MDKKELVARGGKGEQVDAIQADGEVIVSASAGSGKTTTLIHRIIAEIARGTSIKKILVLAYNNAAGEELRDRLANELYKQLLLGDEKESLFRQAIEDLPFANIGTTHSFCSQIIRQNFETLDISPSFEILSDDTADILINAALDAVFEQYLAEQDEVFLEFGDIFSFSRSDSELREIVTRLYSIIDIRPDRDLFFKTVKESYSKDVYNCAFAEIIKQFYLDSLYVIKKQITYWQGIISMYHLENSYENYLRVFQNILLYISNCEASNLKNIITDMDVKKVGLNLGSTKKGANIDTSYVEDLKKVIAEFRTVFGDFKPVITANMAIYEEGHKQGKIYIDKLLEIVERFEYEYKALKNQKNVLTYNDLEHKMIELLNIKGEEIKKDYDVICVDEYQDVNPTQEYIYSHLTNGITFFVGDVKQSIYEFRLADPNIFLAREREYAKNGKAFQFHKNYRSNDEILYFVNSVFSSIMTKETADIDYAEGHDFITTAKEFGKDVQIHFFVEPSEGNPSEKTDVYSIENHQQKDKYESADEMEARFIANTIYSLIGTPRPLTEEQKKNEKEINYNYRFEHFAILFRKRSAAVKIIKALRSFNIPLDIGSFNDAESKPETELIAMLSVIDNPRQDVALVSYLQSILGGYNKNELLEIEKYRENKYTTNYYDAMLAMSKEKGPLAEKVNKTIKTIEEFRLRASFKTVAELLRDIISEFAYDAYLMQKGDSDIAEIEAYITAIESIEENSSLAKFMSVYGKRKNSEDKGGTFGGNRVRLSTYHSFKGLEVPVVFLPALEKDNYYKDLPKVTSFGNGLLAIDYYDSENKKIYKSLERIAVEWLIKRAAEKSEMRLFYVALTRAKEKMYLLSATKKVEELAKFGSARSYDWRKTMIQYIEDAKFNGSLNLIEDKNFFIHTELIEKDSQKIAKLVVPLKDDSVEKIIRESEKYAYPFEEATELSSSYSVSALNTALDSEESNMPSIYEHATKAGTLNHKVMEYIDFNATTKEDIEKEIDNLVAQGHIEESDKSLINVDNLVKVMNSTAIREAANGKEKREVKFTMYVPANEVKDGVTSEDKVLVQGVIDLLFESNGETTLIDYKLTRKAGEVLKNTYKKQLYLYKKAFESAFKKKIDHLGILSLITGEYTSLN